MRPSKKLSRLGALLAILAAGALPGCDNSDTQAVASSIEPTAHLYLAGLDRTGGRVKILDTATGELRAVDVPQLGGDSDYWLVPREGRVVYWTGGDSVYATDPAFTGHPVLLGRASPWMTFIPAAEADRVWLIAGGSDQSIATVEEVTTDGEVTVAPVRPWEGHSPQAATSAGLLFPTEHGTTIWDPVSGKVVGELPQTPFAVSGDLAADCGYPAEAVNVTNVLTSQTRGYPQPPQLGSVGCGEGEFSPDHSHLALTLFPRRSERDAPWPVAVVDLASGETTVVPGLDLNRSSHGSGYLGLAWSSEGDTLYVGDGTGGLGDVDGDLFDYRLGDDQAHELDVGDPDFMRMAAG